MATATYPRTWNLDSLYPNPESDEFAALADAHKSQLRELAVASEKLSAPSVGTAAEWSEFLEALNQVTGMASDLSAIIGCHAAGDAENRAFAQWESQLAAMRPTMEKVVTNIEFLLNALSPSEFDAFVSANESLVSLRFFLEECRLNSQQRLPRDQEILAADLAVDGLHAWGRLYDRVSSTLRVKIMEKGDIVEKSPGQVGFDSADRSVRENNFYAADKAWHSIGDTCADALNHISGTRLTLYRHLGLQDQLDVPLRRNRLQRETLNAMWAAIADRSEMLLQYFEAKANLLGIKRLGWFDQMAPLPTRRGAAELSYDEACRLTVAALGRFSPDFGDFSRRCVTEGWVESEDRVGKRQGGFCTSMPLKQESRIFMTFTNSIDSMSTLAHEIGHAYHSHVLRDEPILLQGYPMCLAETASTFAEAVLGEDRYQAAENNETRLRILDNQLSDAVAFLMNIRARFLFENSYHAERADGELSPDRFRELMLAAQKKAYLNAFADDEWDPNFWISKLHFYISELPYYNFPYTFGYLLSQGLYSLGRDGGDRFPEQYRGFLLATGCMDCESSVHSSFGEDLKGPDFWNRSLDIIEDRVNRFVELAKSSQAF